MACHYDFGDKYIYALGGCLRNLTTVRICEKFDIGSLKWSVMPPMN